MVGGQSERRGAAWSGAGLEKRNRGRDLWGSAAAQMQTPAAALMIGNRRRDRGSRAGQERPARRHNRRRRIGVPGYLRTRLNSAGADVQPIATISIDDHSIRYKELCSGPIPLGKVKDASRSAPKAKVYIIGMRTGLAMGPRHRHPLGNSTSTPPPDWPYIGTLAPHLMMVPATG